MKTEIGLPTGIATINTKGGTSIEIDGFKASVRGLRILEMLNRGQDRHQISDELGIPRGLVNQNISILLENNTPDFSEGKPHPDIQQLIDTAIHHELLNRIALIGIEAVAEERIKQASVREERVRPVEPPKSPKPSEPRNSPKTTTISLSITLPDTTKLITFANRRLDFYVRRMGTPDEEASKMREYVILLLQGRPVSKLEITQNGFDYLKLFRRAQSILIGFGHKQASLRRAARRGFR